jgi:PAS domain S-box-containing protein
MRPGVDDRTRESLLAEIAELRERLDEAEGTLRAIGSGEVDALVITNESGQQVFTLKGAEHGYRVLVQTMNEGAVTLSREGTILYCNQNFASMLKLTLENVIGSEISRFVPGDDRATFDDLHHGGQDGKGEINLVAEDGSKVPVFLSASNLRVDGVPDAVCVVFTDLREQKRNEEIHAAREALLQSSQRYRSLVEATGQVVWTTDPSGEMHGQQDAWAALTGQSEEEYCGLGWLDRVHPAERDMIVRLWQHAVATRTVFQAEQRLLCRSGEYRVFSMRGVPVLDGAGGVREWVGAHADITEHKRIEERDRFLSEAMQVLVSSLDHETVLKGFARLAIPTLGDFCFIDVLRPDGTLDRRTWAHVDPHAEEQFGPWNESVIADDHSPVARALRTGRPVLEPEFRASFVGPATRTFAFARHAGPRSLMSVPLVIGEDLLGCLTVCYDDSGRTHGEAELELGEQLGRRAALALRHANLYRESIERATALERSRVALQHAKDQLGRHATELEVKVAERTARLAETVQSLESVSYMIAHDLRTPLRAMEGFSSVLLEDYAGVLDETARDCARRINAAAIRMDRLIKDLITFGRINQIEAPIAPVDLGVVLNKATAFLADEIASRTADIVVDGPLPAVLGNAVLLEQVLTNLLGNALKFVARGTTPAVRIFGTIEGAEARIWVQDNGIGIEPEHHQRIFKIFERLHVHEFTGTGLGLAIVRKGVERMGGTVGLESSPGHGSRFWIRLPLVS